MSKAVNKKEIASRYALALFESAVENKKLETVATEMTAFQTLTSECPELRILMNADFISRKEKTDAILAVADKAGLSPLMRGFLGVLAENGRLNLFVLAAGAFSRLHEDSLGILSVAVEAARALDDATEKKLTDTLAKIFEKRIRLDVSVKPELIGGLTLRVGCRMVDASIKTKLQKLNLVMKGVGI